MAKYKNYKIGVDVGGTKMSAVLFDGEKVVDDYMLATPRDSLENFMVMLKALLDPLLEKAKDSKKKVESIGIGLPGVIDIKRKKSLVSPNLEIIENIELAKKLEELVGIETILDNDVNCFLRAEMKKGSGHRYSNAYGLTIGTGIGGAWWVNGNIYTGTHGGGGEPGSMIIDFGEGIELEQAYHKLTQDNPSSMAEEAFRGDVLAEKAFEEVGEYLGIAIANIVNLLDPEIIILGGGVMESESLFLAKTKKTMKENIQSTDAKKKIKIVKAKLGLKAGAVGAAMLERE